MVNGKGVLRGSISTDPKRISANLPGTLEFHAYEAPDGGYDLGYSEGYAEGYRVGVSEGKEQGRSEGYTQGHSAGYEAGYAAGYEAGYDKGLADGEASGYEKGVAEVEAQNVQTLAECNTALSEKGVETAESLEEVPERIGEIKVEEDCAKYLTGRGFKNLNLFGKKEIVLNLPNANDITEYFKPDAGIVNNTVEHITINGSEEPILIWAYAAFNLDWRGGNLNHITLNIDFSKCKNNQYLFDNHQMTKVIDGYPFDFTSSTTDITFNYMSALEYVRFVPKSVYKNLRFPHAQNLSDASIQSILDGLADLTGGTAQTLTLHATVGAKLTDEQKAAVAAKNWTLAY